MKHIKTFESYSNTFKLPGPDVIGSKVFYINEDEIKAFKKDSELAQLVEFGTVNIIGNEMWYFEEDENALSTIFPEIGMEQEAL